MPSESWLPVIGYEENYEVSSLGRVRRIKSGKIIKAFPNWSGYLRTGLYKDKHTRVNETIHRLVAKSFLPNPDNLPQVNHMDRDKSNNSIDNLEWCTQSHNISHAMSTPFKVISPEDKIYEITNNLKFEREYGLCNASLSKLRLGKLKTYHGWRVYNEL